MVLYTSHAIDIGHVSTLKNPPIRSIDKNPIALGKDLKLSFTGPQFFILILGI